ncbi:MAG: DUF3482 domain-containing protein [Verrucomicrobiae bacterium]|nr:DUF3482 domain-containing protein [Verrucomicrobiae bacterium]
MPNLPATPTFAIVGRSNEGKTTLMATLTEDDQLEISEIQGTTRIATCYPLEVEDQVIHFWDTPGFQNTAKTHAWFQSIRESMDNPAKAFLLQFERDPEFQNECEIFRPIAEGGAVIYLVDASNRVRTMDRQQLDILRRCGNPRVGVIYSKSGRGQYEDDWKKLLDKELNTRRDFNAHTASFTDRIELLEAVGNVIPEWGKAIAQAIEGLRSQWLWKKKDVAEELLILLQKTLEVEVTEIIQGEDRDAKEQAAEKAKEKLRQKIRELELDFQKRVRKLFKHSVDHWDIDTILVGDLFSEEVWRVFGMTKFQLVVAGAIIGAIIGGTIDAMVGGATFMIGAGIGAVVGGGAAWLSAEKFANVTFPDFGKPLINKKKAGGHSIPEIKIPIGGGKLGGGQARAKVKPESNLIPILIDRGFLYAKLVSQWSHGKRDGEKISLTLSGENRSLVAQWNAKGKEAKQLANFAGQLSREEASRKPEVLEAAREELKGIFENELNRLLR